MKSDKIIHREMLCKFISGQYGNAKRRTKFFEEHISEVQSKRWQEYDNILDLFTNYGPKENEASERARAECVYRWIQVLYAETEYANYNFLKSYESYTYYDGPGTFDDKFTSNEELNRHLRGHFKFQKVLRSTADHLPSYEIQDFPAEDLSPSILKGFIIPKRDKN